MALGTPFRYVLRSWLLLALALLLAACQEGSSTPTPPTGVPTEQATPATDSSPAPAIATTQVKNTLAISEPLPATLIGERVTVKGEGMAFENTIVVEVISNQGVLGRAIVTTDAEPGKVGQFVTTLTVAPVAQETDGLVTIYTTSPVDGTVDQRASVPVKIQASNEAATSPRPIPVAKPNIRINPTRGRPGTEITVVGGNFPAGSEVQIRLSGLNSSAAPEIYATTEAGQHGNIQVSFIMPDRWPDGEPIVFSEVLVLASTPDFVVKATAEFTLDAPTTPQVPTTVTPSDQ